MIDFPPFRLDIANQCLLRRNNGGEERIRLTPKAYSVLRYLAERRGRLVTQDELLDAVWAGVFVQPQAVKAHILEIRSALGDDARMPGFIETLPKRGYRFIAKVIDSAKSGVSLAATFPSRLVGRDRELDELRACMQQTSNGERQIVFVTGEPGIGKTALVDAFESRTAAEVSGLQMARGQCVEGYGGKEAYYPMLEALGQLCRGVGGDAIVATLAARAPTWLAQFPALLNREHREALQREILGATRERMLREISEALESITAATPLLLVFEDLQWTDYSTVDFISALARARAPAQLMLIATYRPVDLMLAEHPLKALKQELLVHKLCREISLGPLEEIDVAHYLATESPEEGVSDGLAELLHRHSDGNPLFMVAALDHLTKQGLISREHGRWQLRVAINDLDLDVPENLRQMIEVRIERLSAEEVRVLEVASVAGVAFSVSIVAGATDLEPETVEDVFDDLACRHRMVRAVGSRQFPSRTVSARYEFMHSLYREVFYRRQLPTRRAKVHGRIGEQLETLFARQLSEAAPELAYHFEHSSDWARAVKYLRLQADAAVRRYAHREATAMLRQAFELSSKLPDTRRAENEIAILETLATIYVASFDMRAIETYDALRERAVHHGMIDVHVRVLVEMAFFLSWISSRRCLEVVERALRLSSGQTDALLRARTLMSCYHWRQMAAGWDPVIAEASRRALGEFRRSGDHLVVAAYVIDFSYVHLFSSEYKEANRSAVEGRAILFDGRDEDTYLSRRYWSSQVVASVSLMFLGEWGDALRESEVAIAMLVRNGDDHRLQKSQLYRAWVYLHAMDFAGALVICESILPLVAADPARIYALRLCRLLAGAAEAALGNHDRALEHLSAATKEMEREKVILDWYWRPLLESTLTEVWLAKGDHARASMQAQMFLEAAQCTAERTFQALAFETNARVALAENDLKLAQDCIAQASATMAGFDVPLAAWRVHATATELYRATGNSEMAQRHREQGRATVLRLADSMDAYGELQETFRSASSVAALLGDGNPGVTEVEAPCPR